MNGPQRSVDSLTVTQIWSLKNETDNRSLHAKLISGLYEKPAALGVQVSGSWMTTFEMAVYSVGGGEGS